jgi:hypothetical protein
MFLRTTLRAAVDLQVLEEMPRVPRLSKDRKKLPDAGATYDSYAYIRAAPVEFSGTVFYADTY